jgi:hypothetical protein
VIRSIEMWSLIELGQGLRPIRWPIPWSRPGTDDAGDAATECAHHPAKVAVPRGRRDKIGKASFMIRRERGEGRLEQA